MKYKTADTKNYSQHVATRRPTKNADDTLVTVPVSTARRRASSSQGVSVIIIFVNYVLR